MSRTHAQPTCGTGSDRVQFDPYDSLNCVNPSSLDCVATTGAPAVLSRWAGQRMPPVLLHRDLWPAALALRGDVGMREVLAGRDDLADVEVTGALGSLDDVDTRHDHERLAKGRYL